MSSKGSGEEPAVSPKVAGKEPRSSWQRAGTVGGSESGAGREWEGKGKVGEELSGGETERMLVVIGRPA